VNEIREILLVEDNPNDIELTLRSLRKHNLADRVFVARDGAEALDYVFGTGRYSGRSAQGLPKVIFLDLKLPKLDGMGVLRKLKSDERTQGIPVVLLTSSLEEQHIVKSYQLAVNSYVIKPVEFDNFARALSESGLDWLIVKRDG
jgi:CheY-like chemotaxis protein